MNFNIIIIGTATFDTFLKGFKYEIINSNVYLNGRALAIAYGSKEKVEIIDHQAGGGAVNIALCLARLGLKSNIITRICKDYEGDFILHKLRLEKNIFTKYIQFDKSMKTASSCILVTGDGERTILSYKGCGPNLVIDSNILNKIKTNMLIVSTIAGNPVNFQAIFEYKKQHPQTILVANPGAADIEILRKNKEWLHYYDIFIVNQEEAAYLSDIDYKKVKELFAWLDKYIEGICIMTMGADGLMFSDRKNIYTAKNYEDIVVIDSTGAGDAFVSGFVVGYYQKYHPIYAVKFGLANSTQVIEKIGANTGSLTPLDLKSDRWKNNFDIIQVNKI